MMSVLYSTLLCRLVGLPTPDRKEVTMMGHLGPNHSPAQVMSTLICINGRYQCFIRARGPKMEYLSALALGTYEDEKDIK
ncbi:hypothetical protein HYPSUDRAFT_542611 [Hypholoma sublateritium FD-334 SS-4]|uniref:Uncharacterized protein n=1 Tax=Hypholoma sublateritium (strain FD-334 SS-4) TaxID=945553 RepID=A0A0D2NAH0_HYPSF|nr:hypothetical protein HYPSUDRAFT_542611 [Hypholoma sublateritium FD-334 SS-4]